MNSDKLTLKFKDVGQGQYTVYIGFVHIGDLLMSEDGFYNWWSGTSRSGYLPSWVLRGIADKVDELNKSWQDTINSSSL